MRGKIRRRSALVALALTAAVAALSVSAPVASAAKHLPQPTPGGGCSPNC